MKNSLTSVKFIASFMKKYFVSLIIVAFFIIFATWLQVISPKIMGDSIDKMVTYVGTSIKHDTVGTYYDQLESGQGLTPSQLQAITANAQLSSDMNAKIQNATPEQQVMLYDYEKLMVQTIQTDPMTEVYSSLAGQVELTEEQKQLIVDTFSLTGDQSDDVMNSSLKQQHKEFVNFQKFNSILKLDDQNRLIDSLNSNEAITIVMLDDLKNTDGVVLSSKLSTDQQKFLTNSTLEEQQKYLNIYNELNDYISMDPTTGTSRELTTEQIQFINSSNVNDMLKYKAMSTPVSTFYNAFITYQSLYTPTSYVDNSHHEFMYFLMILVLSYFFLTLTNYIYNRVMARIAGLSTRDMRNTLFGKLEHLSIRFFDQSNDGDVLSRFTNDIDNISNAMNQSLVQMLSQIAMLVGIVWMMFKEDTSSYTFANGYVLDNVLVISMLLFAVFAIVLALFVIKKAQYYVSRQQSKLGELNGYIDERISGQKIVIAYGLEDQTMEEFEAFNDDYRKTSIKGQIYSGILMPMMNGIGLVNLGALVFLGAIFVANGNMSIGLLVTFIQYSQRFFQPLAQLVSQYNLVQLALSGGSRVKDVIDVEPEIVNKPNAVAIDGINGVVELKDVNFGYYPDKPVLKNINLQVKKGQMIALVGPTGSGKSTVMNLMNRFYDVDSGEINFDGRNIQDITLETLRKNVGIVLQESVLFAGTIRENIAYGDDSATEEMVINAAKTANIHEFIMTLEEGYDTHIDNNTSMFSTGQKQLMSIARTILTNPDLLILDEATSNVDTVTEAKIQLAMENVLQGRTSFVIAHRLKTIMNADEIIVLKDGEIIEQGTHEALLELDGFYGELYKNQFVLK